MLPGNPRGRALPSSQAPSTQIGRNTCPEPPPLARPTPPASGNLCRVAGASEGSHRHLSPTPRAQETAATKQQTLFPLANSWRGRKQIKGTQFKRHSIFFFAHLNQTGKEKTLRNYDQGPLCQESARMEFSWRAHRLLQTQTCNAPPDATPTAGWLPGHN